MPRRFLYTHIKKKQERKKEKVQKREKEKEHHRVDEPQSDVSSLDELYARMISITKLKSSWSDQTVTATKPIDKLKFCKISSLSSDLAQPLVVTHCVIVYPNFSWEVFVYGHKVVPSPTNPLSSIPQTVNEQSLAHLISLLESARVCPGNPDSGFMELREKHKGRFLTSGGELKASVESGFPINWNGECSSSTIRMHDCEILTHEAKCFSCKSYRAQLRAMQSRLRRKNGSPKKFANDRYLNTPQKTKKVKSLRKRCTEAENELERLKKKIQDSADISGVSVDETFHQDLCGIMKEKNDTVKNSFPEGTFRRLFWDEQLKAAELNDSRQMRWHPTMIRWCLNLKLLSSSAYNSLRTSGFIKLPSERTLRDYTHHFKSKPGFQPEVDAMLLKEASTGGLADWKRFVVIIFDELKVRESLVYDKHSSQVIGFVHLGEVDNQVNKLENENCRPEIATHMLCLMVRGIFTGIHIPYANFSTSEVTGKSLFSIVWEAIERLERIGFKVMGLTGDGASPNRKLFSLHSVKGKETSDITYRVKNTYTDENRYIHFFSDTPHLMKTVRNCWSHSFWHGWTRKLWINGKHISWEHLCSLYRAKMSLAERSEGLYLLKKLSKEHVDLNSYSCS